MQKMENNSWLIKLFLLVLQLTQSLASSNIELIREFTGDSVKCPNNVNCRGFDAEQVSPDQCVCKGSSLVKVGESLKCKLNVQDLKECIFHFQNYEDKLPAISIHSELAKDFINPVVSKTTSCSKMAISSVDYFDAGIQLWIPFIKPAFTILSSSSGSFAIRWSNPFSVDTEYFGGNLVKFNLKCENTINGINKNSLCVIGKIIGARNFTDHSKICEKSHQNNKMNNQNKGKTTDISAMVGAIVAVLFIVFLIVLVVCFCRNKKCKKVTKAEKRDRATSLSEVQLKSTSDYAEPSGIGFPPPLDSPTNFENKSYMTAFRGNHHISTNNNNKNYENFPPTHHQPMSGEERSTVKPFLSSNNDYEQIHYEDPDNGTGERSVNSYEPLENSERPAYHTLANVPFPNPAEEFYEEMDPKSGTV